ncbi:MAG: hypothetical protein C3F02_03950 [Parcubacteria group bacterium]|nr:MAG: hypothetical protein C3F02_03950 [Parcubacteria group bacterium]
MLVSSVPPVPVSDIVFFNYLTAITSNGDGWINQNFNTWVNLGPVPGGAVNVQPETWSGMKERYR